MTSSAPASNPFVDMMNASEYTFADIKASLEEKLPEIRPVDLKGKNVIVTGANAGVGYETAKSLAGMNPQKLILACRNAEKANAALSKIKSATKNENIEVWELDLASFKSTKAFAKKYNDLGVPLDILVSNAGVLSPAWAETEDKFEATVQVNHLANALLILGLTPSLQRAKNPRINIVSSDVHFWSSLSPDTPKPVSEIIAKPENYSSIQQYAATKLLNILFAFEYARRCPFPVTIVASNPGYTDTEFGGKDPVTGSTEGHSRANHNLFPMRPTYEGAKSLIHASIADVPSGSFVSESRVSRTRESTKGEVGRKFGRNAWNDTLEILKARAGAGEFAEWIEKKD